MLQALRLNRKGYWYFGVGSLFLLLVVAFVAIAMASPNVGQQITNALHQLFGAVKG